MNLYQRHRDVVMQDSPGPTAPDRVSLETFWKVRTEKLGGNGANCAPKASKKLDAAREQVEKAAFSIDSQIQELDQAVERVKTIAAGVRRDASILRGFNLEARQARAEYDTAATVCGFTAI